MRSTRSAGEVPWLLLLERVRHPDGSIRPESRLERRQESPPQATATLLTWSPVASLAGSAAAPRVTAPFLACAVRYCLWHQEPRNAVPPFGQESMIGAHTG